VITTAGNGQGQVRDAQTSFTSSLIGEALVYFDKEANLAPVTKTETVTQDTGKSLFSDSSSTSETTTELVERTTPISGFALFIVSPFGNRVRSLDELTLKLTSNWDRESVIAQITSLREVALQSHITSVATPEKTKSKTETQEENSEDFGAKPKQSRALFDDSDDWDSGDPKTKSKSLWDDDDNDSGPSTKRNLWDD
jgi:hypothetical protein